MAISVLIPDRNQNRLKVLRQGSGDKQTVAFGASENSRPMGYLRSPVSVKMRD